MVTRVEDGNVIKMLLWIQCLVLMRSLLERSYSFLRYECTIVDNGWARLRIFWWSKFGFQYSDQYIDNLILSGGRLQKINQWTTPENFFKLKGWYSEIVRTALEFIHIVLLFKLFFNVFTSLSNAQATCKITCLASTHFSGRAEAFYFPFLF
jgi:hypothetical protein